MRTAGIIAEYNPFHEGHQYHIEETRKKTGADFIIVAMSGDFVQRGEPAIVDKYLRCRMALAGGADVVLELPTVYATASAEYFASAGVKLFHNLRCVDYLSFGSEWADVEEYEPYVQALVEESERYGVLLREELKKGNNFPTARSSALCACLREKGDAAFSGDEKTFISPEEFLACPNHILGLEYLKALKRLDSHMIPVAVKRAGSGYHEETLTKEFPSATAIRKYLKQYVGDEGKQEFPDGILQENGALLPVEEKRFLTAFQSGNYVLWEDLMPCLDYEFLMGQDREIFGMDRELFLRMKKEYRPGKSFEEITGRLHSRRLTDAAIKRALLHYLLQIEKPDFLNVAARIPVPYARVLGFRKTAAPLLKKIRRESEISLIQRPVEGVRSFTPDSPAAFLYRVDLRAAALYEQTAARKSGRSCVEEMTRNQIIME